MQFYKILSIIIFLLVLAGSPALVADEPPINATDWIIRSDSVMRGETNRMKMTLKVHTSKWERIYEYDSWMKGVDSTFMRVTGPARFKGQGFLKIGTRLWNYLPTAERTILIPPSLMMDNFMGSDFSNDDLVKMSYIARDYTHAYLKEEILENESAYVLELLPKPDAPVVYGKLVTWLRKKDAAPLKAEFYDFKMNRIRTLHYLDFKLIGDREYPTVWRMVNHEKPGNETVITVNDAQFNIAIDDEIFTKKNLESA